MELLSERLRFTLHRAAMAANDRRHTMVEPEHLLVELLEDEDARSVLERSGADISSLRDGAITEVERLPKAPAAVDPRVSASFQQIIQQSVIWVQSTARLPATGADVLLFVAGEGNTAAGRVLLSHDLPPEVIERFLRGN